MDAERRGKAGHGFARVAWLETLDLDPTARPVLVESEEGFERWDGHGALGYLVLDEIVRGPSPTRPSERGSSWRDAVSRPGRWATGCVGLRKAGS